MKGWRTGWNGDAGPDDRVLRARGGNVRFVLPWFDDFWEEPSKAFQEFSLVCLKLLLLEDQGPKVAV